MKAPLRHFVFLVAIIFLCTKVFAHGASDNKEIYTIESITEITPFLEKLGGDAIVVFDVDFVITAPADFIGLPGSKEVRKEIFKEYSKEHGKERAKYLFILFNKLVPRPLVEDEIGTIIQNLLRKNIHTIALSAIGTNPIGPVANPMAFRIKKLKEVGVYFTDLKKGEKFLWGEESGFHEGVILSGKQPKGEALLHYLTKIVNLAPSRVVFLDDNLENVKNVQKMCRENNIPFWGFHYVAEFFKGKIADSKIAKLQFKTLQEEGKWLSDDEARDLLKPSKGE